MNKKKTGLIGASCAALLMLLSGCAVGPQMARPDQLVAPEPIANNSGKYMNPYTQDGVLAPWVDKAVNAKMGAAIGKQAGAYMGQKAMENIPFVGGMLGSKLGEAAGRKIAIEASGGMEYIQSSSDSSFNSVQDMSVYLYVKHSNHKHYQDALNATMEIYPELKQGYHAALMRAPRK